MSICRRLAERFDAFLIVKFRPHKEVLEYSLGITSNCSQEGFCFETQTHAFDRGEILEFILKHPDIDYSVSGSGEVVWIREDYDKCVTGVRFRDINEDNNINIADFFTAVETANACSCITADPVSGSGHSHDVVVSKKGPAPGDEMIEKAGAQRPDNDHRDLQMKRPGLHARTAASGRAYTRIKKYKKKGRLFVALVLIIAAISAVVLSGKFQNIRQSFLNLTAPIPVMTDQNTDRSPPAAFTDDSPEVSMADQELNGQITGPGPVDIADLSPDEEQPEMQLPVPPVNVEPEGADEPAGINKTPAETDAAEGEKFFVQVGTWKNSDNAHVMLKRLQQAYPEARIIAKGSFQIVVIPDIITREESAVISKNIEKEFDLKPLIISATYYRETGGNSDVNESGIYAAKDIDAEIKDDFMHGGDELNKETETDNKQVVFKIKRFVIAGGVQEREPVGITDTFLSSTGYAYAFLEAGNITGDTMISFVWYFGEEEVARVDMPLGKGYRWRTFSNKRLEGRAGEWKVELRDENGAVLDTRTFRAEY